MQLKKFDSINVVPFIDIMLVLLVIVLTTASFVAKGVIPLDLSEAHSSIKLKEQKELAITISKDGVIYFNEKMVTKENLINNLQTYKTNTQISIACDKSLKFDGFIYILDILKEQNFSNISIITKQSR